MIHLDLFSGIGGFALAVDEVWNNVGHVFCEIDNYCQALLKKRFEGSLVYGDIRELTRERVITDTKRDGYSERYKDLGAEIGQGKEGGVFEPARKDCFILTGGFPCQPFSQAGKRKGTDDNRYLWHEMFRVIQDFKPQWVIAENVCGILTIEGGMVFQQVCLDLEGEGYEVQPFIIPAVAKNAPHRRYRVWFVGNAKTGCNERHERKVAEERKYRSTGSLGDDKSNTHWDQDWLEVATELCGMDDGLPAELDGLKLSKSRHRVERLKALGNAIVPQIAVEIMRGFNDKR